jgi:cob(I)alamin adenosyltransferase
MATVTDTRPGTQIHLYTGDGKGKTTAAIGLAVRAAGAGMRVLFIQFLKGRPTSELNALALLADRITMRRFGGRHFVQRGGGRHDAALAQQGLVFASKSIDSGDCDLVVLDEINLAVTMGLLAEADVLDLIDTTPAGVTLVLTGRYAPDSFIERADVVTEMKEVKHHYRLGATACVGIEM